MDKLELGFQGGDPLTLDDLEFMQNSIRDAFKGLASVFQYGSGDPVLIYGLNAVVSGSDNIFSDGYIIYNKEIYFVQGGTFAISSVLVIDVSQTYDTNGDQTFENLTVNQTWAVRRGILKISTGGPNEIDVADIITLKQAFQAIGIITTDTFASNLEIQRQLYFQARVPNAGSSVTGATGVFKFSTIDLNPNSWYDSSTGKFQPQVAGWYECHFNICARINNAVSNFIISISLSKNSINSGPYVHSESQYGGSNKNLNMKGSLAVYFNGTSDYAYPTFGMTSSETLDLLAGSTLTWKFIRSTA